MEKTSILKALEIIKNSYSVENGLTPFSLEYFRNDGTVGYKEQVIVWKKALSKKQRIAEKSRFNYSLKETGNLLLYDLAKERPFSKEFFLLRKINGQFIYYE